MKIAAGVQPAGSGTLRIDGAAVRIESPRRARELGIALVPQEPALCPNLSVEENLALGCLPARVGLVNRAELRARARQALARAALNVAPEAPLDGLSAAARHLLQIARALSQQARLLILDEPTAALSEGEAAHLFARLRLLRAEGVTILYISHRLPEIFALCDTITTLRDGRHVATQPRQAVSPSQIVAQMAGAAAEAVPNLKPPSSKQLPQPGGERGGQAGAPVLRVAGLGREPYFRDVDLTIEAGEIVALAGLVGSGRSKVARCLFGLDRPLAGIMQLGGETYKPRSVRDAMRCGVALVPEDRREQGLVMGLSVAENLLLPARALGLVEVARRGWLWRRGEEELVTRSIDELAIKCGGAGSAVETLSGGNQQKVVIARWLSIKPRLLVVDEPTQGIDVGAKAQVHSLLRQLAAGGCAVLMVSSDLAEVLELADRILVMRSGRPAGTLLRGATAAQVMGLAALGEVVAA
jgi:rhamnose transport system ATP-binding protein